MKLGGFGPVYVINLPRRTDRREHMEKLFKDYGINDYTFIEAFSVEDDLDFFIDKDSIKTNKAPRKVEIATTMSHIKAIKYWLDTSDTDYAIFCEDDVCFDTVQYWPWTWKEFIGMFKKEYDVIQLSITQFGRSIHHVHKRRSTDYSAGIYLLKREHAQSIINRMIIKDKYIIDNIRKNSVIDHEVIYGNTKNAYSCSLFTYKTNLGSDTNPDGITYHNRCRHEVIRYWQNNKMQLQDFLCIT